MIAFFTLVEVTNSAEKMDSFKYRFQKFVRYTGYDYKQHQEDGLLWCIQREQETLPFQNINGGIIADEMGCGKTFMTVSLIVCNFVPRTLIVVPLALLGQWKETIMRTTGHQPLLYYGHYMSKAASKLHESPIVLTTYGVITQKMKEQDSLYDNMWDRVVFDEAHHMRTTTTQKYKAGYALKAKIKWLITGTPIQNKLHDLSALCSLFGLKSIHKINREDLDSIILRRTKQDVGIQLPSLLVHEQVIPWANEDEKVVAQILHQFTNSVENDVEKKIKGCSYASDEKQHHRHDVECIEDYEEDYGDRDSSNLVTLHTADNKYKEPHRVECIQPHENKSETTCKLKQYVKRILGSYYLSYYLRCRQMCVCPSLLNKLQQNVDKCEAYDTNILDRAFYHINKVDYVSRTIKNRCYNGNHKIVFCNFRQEMDIVRDQLLSHGIYDVAIYDGRASRKQRNDILMNKPQVLIIQIQMGCEGLNLQYANEIYFVGPLWNPAMEDQAIARCYRMGQDKETHVFKYRMEDINIDGNMTGSMDNYMHHVNQNKQTLRLF